jgi:patatin-related protein
MAISSTTTAPAPSPSDTVKERSSSGAIRELRLGLVCYGGVSLAIYMHGITKEIHKLVIASNEYESAGDSTTNPFDPSTSEHTYWELLKNREVATGVRTRVVVDVISGTSAGGINGIFLAKALAHDLSQQSLRDLWINKGDIKKLLRGWPWLPLWSKVPWLAASILYKRGNIKPPLRGSEMCSWLYDALKDMDGKARRPDSTLVAQGNSLELFVTLTDFYGYRRAIPIQNNLITDARHRHVMAFTQDSESGLDQFRPEYNQLLGFSARGTSCFPGAFPPINLEGYGSAAKQPGVPEELVSEFFRIYELSEEQPAETYFIDGGVLDNFPFSHAIDAIIRKPAATEVVRRLVYIEPDPGALHLGPHKERNQPRWPQTLTGAMSGIRGDEPILDDLMRVRQFNDRVNAINSVVGERFPEIRDRIDQLTGAGQMPDSPTEEQVRSWSDKLHAEAKSDLGAAYEGYQRLKVTSVVDRFAEMIDCVCNFPKDSNEAEFVNEVLLLWAIGEEILSEPTDATRAVDRRGSFLRSFDLPYAQRRLRFVIQGVNQLYKGVGSDLERRRVLDQVKQTLYDRRAIISALLAGRDLGEDIVKATREVFGEQSIRIHARRDTGAAEFIAARRKELDALLAAFKKLLDERLEGFGTDIYRRFIEVTKGLSPEDRRMLLVRYLGFPMWDALIFPMRAMSEVGELDPVRVVRFSPTDATRLEAGGARAKLKGVSLHHFGAFFKRDSRQSDYLWGRLDGIESLISLLTEEDPPDERAKNPFYRRGFEAIFQEEKDLSSTPAVQAQVKAKLDELPG